MKRLILGLALAASMAAPLAAGAQTPPSPPERMGSPERMAPPPDVRAKFDKINADAKTAAYAALSAEHRTRVQALVGQVIAGSVPPRDAADQIDALLSTDEKRGVLAAAQKAHDDMRAAMGVPEGAPHLGMPGGPPPPNLPPPGAPPMAGVPAPGGPMQAGPPGDRDAGREMRRTPNAGRRLLMMSLTRDQMHALRAKPAPKT